MKAKVFFGGLILFFISISTFSQQYNSLVIENAQWRILYDDDATPWPDAMQGWLLRGDTVLNDHQYKKLYRRIFEDPSSNIIITQYLYGFLREDIENKVVFALESESLGCDTLDQEYILFDFSYEVGDTSQLCIHTEQLGYCILLDTHYTNIYGADRKIFEFCNSSSAFIEGIGHDQGLLESPVINISGGGITSLFEYCVGTDEECNVLYVKLDEQLQTIHYKVYPNPCTDYFILEYYFEIIPTQASYSISDPLGRIIEAGLIEGQQIK